MSKTHSNKKAHHEKSVSKRMIRNVRFGDYRSDSNSEHRNMSNSVKVSSRFGIANP